MRIACWIPKVTNKNSEYAFQLLKFLQVRASVLRYMYIARLAVHPYVAA
jgi:hypothetical protein